MTNASKYALIREMLDSAESNVRSAKHLLSEVSGLPLISKTSYVDQASLIEQEATGDAERVVKGVFNGQSMIDSDNNSYPVPANYASKSKLVPGDTLKLSITEEGKFIYKQIQPIDRKSVIGPLINEDGQYKVLAEGKVYKVLLASVTYFRADVGDEVTLVIPANEESEWGAIEAILPKFQNISTED